MPDSGAIPLHPSPLAGLVMLIFFAAAGYGIAVAIDGFAGLALCTAVLALGMATVWRLAWLGADASVLRIALEDGENATAELRNGRIVKLTRRGAHAGSLGTYLAASHGGAKGIFLVPGVLDPQSHRLLRIWCKWGRLERARIPPDGKTESA